MDADTVDLITYLPPKIIGRILNKVPIKDAIKTSILSREWRYKWTTISDLDFNLKLYAKNHHLAKSIAKYFSLHKGTVNKFFISRINNPKSILKLLCKWLFLLSKRGIKELCIGLKKPRLFRVPSSHLFKCTELTHLELYRCKINSLPPPSSVSFKGFLLLKFIKFQDVIVSDYNSFISYCPLLESLTILTSRPEGQPKLNLTLSAPNLKYLMVRESIRSIYLENTPLLNFAKVATHKLVDEEVRCCNFDRFFEKIPCLEKLTGEVSFTRYLSKGIEERSDTFVQQQYSQLTSIKLDNICFEEKDEILVLLRLIINSPNLKKLNISEMFKKPEAGRPADDDVDADGSLSDSEWPIKSDSNVKSLDWKLIVKKECPRYKEYIFKELERVEISKIQGRKSAMLMKLIKFILKRSPNLEVMMFLWPKDTDKIGKLEDLSILSSYRRASTKARFHVPQLDKSF